MTGSWQTRWLMAAIATLTLAPAGLAQDFDDPGGDLRDQAYVFEMAPALCGNAYLRHALQRTYVQIGDRENGMEEILNCYERSDRMLRANVSDLLRALDVACPGADVRLWMTNPQTVPDRGCGQTYVEPDWGTRPTLEPEPR